MLQVEAEEVSPDALLRKQHSTNDNYCIAEPELVARSMDYVLNTQRQDFSVTVQAPVLCPVVSSVRSVLNRRGQSSKKVLHQEPKEK